VLPWTPEPAGNQEAAASTPGGRDSYSRIGGEHGAYHACRGGSALEACFIWPVPMVAGAAPEILEATPFLDKNSRSKLTRFTFARATILGRRLQPRRSSAQGKKAYDRIV
jgi:hypothetical protein